MKGIMAGVLIPVMACAIGVSAQEKAASIWDEGASRNVLASTEKLFMGVVEQMSVEPLKPHLASDIVAYDIDFEGKPVKITSRDEAIRYFETIFSEAKKVGAKARIDKKSFTCRATSSMAFCLFEYDFVAVMPDGATMTQPTQTTIVLNKVGDTWQWTHWHSALSAPVPSAPAPGK